MAGALASRGGPRVSHFLARLSRLPALCSRLVKAFMILALVAQLTLPVLAANQLGEQTVTPITPSQEQRVEPLSPGTEQRVEMVNAEGVQAVGQGTDNPVQRGVGAVSKV